MPDVVIIGAGISGLSAAHHLLSRRSSALNLRVIVLEAAKRAGGVLFSEKMDGYVLEHGSDSFITNKPWAINLCSELGLQDKVLKTNELNRRSLIASKGELVSVPDGFRLIAPTRFWPFLLSDLFSLAGKIRVGYELFMPASLRPEDESVASFVSRRFGHELLERAAQPLVGGIYTGDVDQLSAQATLPNFLELEEKYGSVIRGLLREERERSQQASGARYAIFNTLTDGMGSVIDCLVKELPPESLLLNCGATSLHSNGDGKWKILSADGVKHNADAVIMACAARTAGSLFDSIDRELANLLKQIENASSVVINFLFRNEDLAKPTDGFGFVVPSIEKRSIIAVSYISIKYTGRAPAGQIMLRVFMGGSLNYELTKLQDDELKEMALKELKYFLKTKGDPVRSWLKRWPDSMPQYKVGHKLLVSKIEERLKAHAGLALAGNSYGGVGIPDCIQSGKKAALMTLDSLRMRGL
jgi:protoporphyrinogen/coproporphyrinogen III oxidase